MDYANHRITHCYLDGVPRDVWTVDKVAQVVQGDPVLRVSTQQYRDCLQNYGPDNPHTVQLKRGAPAVKVAGLFAGSDSTSFDWSTHTGLYHYDLDKLPPGAWDQIRPALQNIPCFVMAARSLSGAAGQAGWCLLAGPPARHRADHRTLWKQLFGLHLAAVLTPLRSGVDNVSDVNRLRFLAADADLLYQPVCTPALRETLRQIPIEPVGPRSYLSQSYRPPDREGGSRYPDWQTCLRVGHVMTIASGDRNNFGWDFASELLLYGMPVPLHRQYFRTRWPGLSRSQRESSSIQERTTRFAMESKIWGKWAVQVPERNELELRREWLAVSMPTKTMEWLIRTAPVAMEGRRLILQPRTATQEKIWAYALAHAEAATEFYGVAPAPRHAPPATLKDIWTAWCAGASDGRQAETRGHAPWVCVQGTRSAGYTLTPLAPVAPWLSRRWPFVSRSISGTLDLPAGLIRMGSACTRLPARHLPYALEFLELTATQGPATDVTILPWVARLTQTLEAQPTSCEQLARVALAARRTAPAVSEPVGHPG